MNFTFSVNCYCINSNRQRQQRRRRTRVQTIAATKKMANRSKTRRGQQVTRFVVLHVIERKTEMRTWDEHRKWREGEHNRVRDMQAQINKAAAARWRY